MEEFYTFNSQQLSTITANKRGYSDVLQCKKILSFNDPTRVSPSHRRIPKQQKQCQNTSSKRQSTKRVKIVLPLEKIIEQKLTTNIQNKLLQTKSRGHHKITHGFQIFKESEKKGREGNHLTRPLRALTKRAFSAVERQQNEQKNLQLSEENNCKKKRLISENKINKVALNGVSFGKLPSVFRTKLGEKYSEGVFVKQLSNHIPKIRSICQEHICIGQSSSYNLSKQIQKLKKRLIIQNRCLQKLSLLL